jgi:hypothetical protein
MPTNIDIASQALLLIRADTIASFSDDTNNAQIVSTMYDDFINSLLSQYPWTFATKKRLLSRETATPVNEYSYIHIIPSDALLMWAVFDSDRVGATPVREYEIYGSASGRRIYSNYETLYADYTYYADESTWHPTFVNFVINALASRLAVPVTGSVELADYYMKIAYGSLQGNHKGGLLGLAMSTDSKQKRNEFIFSNPLIEERFS